MALRRLKFIVLHRYPIVDIMSLIQIIELLLPANNIKSEFTLKYQQTMAPQNSETPIYSKPQSNAIEVTHNQIPGYQESSLKPNSDFLEPQDIMKQEKKESIFRHSFKTQRVSQEIYKPIQMAAQSDNLKEEKKQEHNLQQLYNELIKLDNGVIDPVQVQRIASIYFHIQLPNETKQQLDPIFRRNVLPLYSIKAAISILQNEFIN